VKYTKAKAKDVAAEAESISAKAMKKATDDAILKICEQIYGEECKAT
jgi:hypothetical protein